MAKQAKKNKETKNPLLKALRSAIPPISPTEQTALDAGTVGWEQSIFNGNPDWEKITSYGAPRLTKEEQSFLDNEVEELCAMIDNWQVRQDMDLPENVWQYIKDKKFWGMLIGKEHGGLGFSSYARSEIVKKIATRSQDAAVAIMVPNSLGPGELLEKYGTPEQQKTHLERLANGKETPCFGLTEPGAGSDAFGAMRSKGVVEKDLETGKPTVKLNFDKRYITLGPKASLLGIAFKLEDPDNLLGKGTNPGFSLALLPSSMKGVENGNRHLPMNQTFPNGTLRGRDVMIDPQDHIIGGVDGIGKGDRMLMECLSEGRANSLPSLAAAGAQYATWTSSAYSAIRQQFKMSVSNFPGIEEKIAEMAGLSYKIEALREATIQMVDNGEKPTVSSAIAKYHATEMMRTALTGAMDVHAGKGIQSGPNNYLNPIFDGIPVAITVEGANILTRNMLVFGQGSYRLHPHLKNVKTAVDNGQTLKALAGIAKTGGSVIGSVVKGVFHGVTRDIFTKTPKMLESSPLAPYYKDVNRLSTRFNAIANPLAVGLGGKLKFKEDISARMGDALSQLYMASAVLKKHDSQARYSEELTVARWAVEDALHEADQAMDDILRKENFPRLSVPGFGLVRPLMKMATFFDKKYKSPDFKLRSETAKAVINDTPARDRLTSAVYIPNDPDDPVFKLNRAFKLKGKVTSVLSEVKELAREHGLDKNDPLGTIKALHDSPDVSYNWFHRMSHESPIKEYEALREDIEATDEFAPDNLRDPVRPEPAI